MEHNNDLLKNLNDAQLAAILYNEGPSIIIAGAGSGKTKVLTHKIAYLINALKIKSERILAVTFTNKAAKEMEERVIQLLKNDSRNIKIFTYHAFCVQVLRREIHNLNMKNNFNIIDNIDQKQILKDIYQNDFNHKLEPGELKLLIPLISKWKNQNLTKTEIIYNYYEKEEWVLRANVYERYKEYQHENSYLDFDDLLIFTAKLFSEFPDISEKWQQQFDFILVDEFQDTNKLQYQILLALTSRKQNLTVVGDPDQTIYTWRGANVNLILKFTEKFPTAETFILNQNYRSTTKILNLANNFIANNQQRIEKNLFTVNNLGEDIHVYHAPSANFESNWVASVIKKIILKENIKLNQIAVLYRNNHLAKDLEDSFIYHNINYRIIGGLKFFERKEIKDFLAYLKVITWNDNLSMIRILNDVPKIGTKTIELLRSQAEENNLSLSQYLVLFQNNLTKNHKTYLQSTIDWISDFQNKIKTVTSLHELATKLLESTNFLKKLKEEHQIDRIESIKRFLELLVEFDSKHEILEGEILLTTFLQETAIETDISKDKNSKDAVNFLTIHNSKGLEFEVVFVIGINEEIIPGINKREPMLKSKNKLEEERRLFYVALTRAKKFLFLSDAKGFSYVLNRERTSSSFFEELDLQYLKFVNPKVSNSSNQEKIYTKNHNFNKIISNISYQKVNKSVAPNNLWKISDILTHELFGKGIVTKIIGDKIEVAFHKNNGGIKILNCNHPLVKKVI